MRPLIQSLISRIQPALTHLPRYAVTGAWFFAIASMIPLLWIMLEGKNDGTSQVFGTTVDGIAHTVWGLTYHGVAGWALLWIELLAVLTAIVFTVLPSHSPMMREQVVVRLRRIGHGTLTAWAGLWMLGVLHLSTINPGFWTLQAIFLMALFACTVYRTMREWSPVKNAVDETDDQSIDAPKSNPVSAVFASDTQHPLTDDEDVSRFMLMRSAVRPSSSVREIEFDHSTPERAFAEPQHRTHIATEPDEYGATLRATLRKGLTVARDAARAATAQIRIGAEHAWRFVRDRWQSSHRATRTTSR